MSKGIAYYAALALGLFGLVAPLHAQTVAGPEVTAFGRSVGMLGCNLTDQGLIVEFSHTGRTQPDGLGAQGELCLPILARFPESFIGEPLFGQLDKTAEGDTTDIPDCIIWDIDSADVTRATVACDPDDRGVLRTIFVDSGSDPIYRPEPDEECFVTLANLQNMNLRARQPVAAGLGEDANGNVGTLVYTAHGDQILELVECALSPDGPPLLTRFHESSVDGVLPVAIGELCHDTLARLQDRGLEVKGPVPSTARPADSNPGSLIWNIAVRVSLEP